MVIGRGKMCGHRHLLWPSPQPNVNLKMIVMNDEYYTTLCDACGTECYEHEVEDCECGGIYCYDCIDGHRDHCDEEFNNL
jgi:late competence protein required for DNA uptake (superfamily II DNA/RNA helicase)